MAFLFTARERRQIMNETTPFILPALFVYFVTRIIKVYYRSSLVKEARLPRILSPGKTIFSFMLSRPLLRLAPTLEEGLALRMTAKGRTAERVR
jgi:hypothetical protein